MIDLHSHVLPGIDDGAKDIKTTLEMLEIAVEDGIKKIIATPHYYKGYYENNYEDICKLTNQVNCITKEKALDITVIPGQEIFLDKHTLEMYRQGTIKGIGGTKYMLIELPMENMPKDALDIIYELKIEGIKPIVAHPERYNYIIESPSKINDFIREGCLFQINSGSIKGIFGKKIKKTSEILIQNGICDFIASDAHTTGSRSPRVKDALEQLRSLNISLVDNIKNNSEKLLKNLEINSQAHSIKEKRRLFGFFKR